MLTDLDKLVAPDASFAALRTREFSRVDEAGLAYLDYAGAALHAQSQVVAHHDLLATRVFGNPHSENDPSRVSTAMLDEARSLILRFLDADPSDYVVCFTANTSSAIKLVAESFPFGPGGHCVLTADNHNSMNGLREYARRAGAVVRYIPLDPELRLVDADAQIAGVWPAAPSLFGFPAQSNFSGVRHPLNLVERAEASGYDVLLDAAALLPTSPLSLRAVRPAFVALSFYKLFGYPTGVGALVARRDALDRLRRPWFAGGTVDFVSVEHGLHQQRPLADGFEDGTPNFLGISALATGFALLDHIGLGRISAHVGRLTRILLCELDALTHADGRPLVRRYGPSDLSDRGSTVAFNVLDHGGRAVPFARVIERARAAGVALRGGCFCNPGAAETAFGFPAEPSRRCLQSSAGTGFSIERFADCLGPDVAVGAVRASLGLATNDSDLQRAVAVVASFTA
jgi:selenocysteine lyase/cysteine desulfurase